MVNAPIPDKETHKFSQRRFLVNPAVTFAAAGVQQTPAAAASQHRATSVYLEALDSSVSLFQ